MRQYLISSLFCIWFFRTPKKSGYAEPLQFACEIKSFRVIQPVASAEPAFIQVSSYGHITRSCASDGQHTRLE